MNYKQVSAYGRIAVGQLVNYSAATLAPTNSARPCGCMRDPSTQKIINPDNTIGFDAVGRVSDLLMTDTGCMATVALQDGGALRLHINSYGQDVGGFRSLKVLHDAPRQMELAA